MPSVALTIWWVTMLVTFMPVVVACALVTFTQALALIKWYFLSLALLALGLIWMYGA